MLNCYLLKDCFQKCTFIAELRGRLQSVFFRGQTALNLSSDDPKFLALTVSGTLNIQILEYEGV